MTVNEESLKIILVDEKELQNIKKTHEEKFDNNRKSRFFQYEKYETPLEDIVRRADYSIKYDISFYITTWSTYKRGPYYSFSVFYKNKRHSFPFPGDADEVLITDSGEELIVEYSNEIYEFSIQSIIKALEENTEVMNGTRYVDKESFEKEQEKKRRSIEAEIVYRCNYPNEYGDD